MSKIAWGKPRIFIKNLDEVSGVWKQIPTPVEDSTSLNPTKGDKLEAKIEGGENEDVKYKKSNYEFVYSIREMEGREMPIAHDEGSVVSHYAVALQPENPKARGFIIDKSAVSVEDGFNAADGATWVYSHDVLKPDTGKKVKWGIISVTESGDGFEVVGEGADFE